MIIKQGSQMHDRKSDGSVVPMKSGNATEGRQCHSIIALVRDTLTTHRGRDSNDNKTRKNSRTSKRKS